eukprot:676661-Pleurochrysis_carterae.AAC.2
MTFFARRGWLRKRVIACEGTSLYTALGVPSARLARESAGDGSAHEGVGDCFEQTVAMASGPRVSRQKCHDRAVLCNCG